jgi:peptidoglycan hydrolase FlgJ
MSLPAISSVNAAPAPAWARALETPGVLPSLRGAADKPTPADVKKAAGQFEAIILRQLLSPSIEPMMNGGLGGSGSGGGGGGGVYSYMLTDVLCNSLGAAGGLGLGRMLEKQFSPPVAPAAGELTSSSIPQT